MSYTDIFKSNPLPEAALILIGMIIWFSASVCCYGG